MSAGVGLFIGKAILSTAISWGIGRLTAKSPPDMEGPRITDLRAQSSAYGNQIPKLYGTMRVGGNLIWSLPIKETAHSHEEGGGGKGGGGGSQTVTEYTYSQTFAIGLCEGEIIGIKRVWANGKLISDGSGPNKLNLDGATLYVGSESQQPDGTIQADKGVADTPAFRGLAYIVFNDFQLGDYGNRLPQLEFEVMAKGAATGSLVKEIHIVANSGGDIWPVTRMAFSPDNKYLYAAQQDHFVCIDTTTNEEVWNISVSAQRNYVMSVSPNGRYVVVAGTYINYLVDTSTRTSVGLYSSTLGYWYPHGVWAPDSSRFYVVSTKNDSHGFIAIDAATGAVIIEKSLGTRYVKDIGITSDGQRLIVIAGQAPTVLLIETSSGFYAESQYAAYSNVYGLYGPVHVVGPADGFIIYCQTTLGGPGLVQCPYGWLDPIIVPLDVLNSAIYNNPFVLSPDNRYLYYGGVSPDTGLARLLIFDLGANSGLISAPVIADSDTAGRPAKIFVVGSMVYLTDYSYLIHVFDGATSTFIGTIGLPYNTWGNAYIVIGRGDYAYMPVGNYSSTYYIGMYRLDIGGVSDSVEAIISDLCAMVGVTNINAASLAGDSLAGYAFTRSGSVRKFIEPLAKAFFFDVVESDGVLNFVKRGGSPAITIGPDDLGVGDYGSEPPPLVTITRAQDVELPQEVTVLYIDKSTGYEAAGQYARRLTGRSSNKVSVELAMVMTATEAKRIAEAILYALWQARTTFKFSVNHDYSTLEPGDVIQLAPDAGYVVRLTRKDEVDGKITFDAEIEDAQAYIQTAPAPAPLVAADSVDQIQTTDLALLDIPLLRDQDNGYGFYMAACGTGFGNKWGGCQVFRSVDGNASWQQLDVNIYNAAVIGFTRSVLEPFASGNIFDESNSVVIYLISGAVSATDTLGALNGANTAVIGNELVTFRDAVLIDQDTYQLSGLLRGRLGTEWAMAVHAANERFVLLNSTSIYPAIAAQSRYGATYNYRAVSFGSYPDTATISAFTWNAVASKCLSPVHIGGGRASDGDIIINWIRRTRISGGWTDGADVPLGEDTEAYEIDIWDDAAHSNKIRTITGLTAATATYTAAEQITDFGAAQTTIYLTVYQLSATYGRGYGADGEV